MQHKRLAAGLLAALASFANADGESDVTQLTRGTFDDFIKANDLVLAECKLPLHSNLPVAVQLLTSA